jgi:hypothetical protein
MMALISRVDLIHMIKGTGFPNIDIIDHPLIKRCGKLWGGHNIEWQWNNHFDDDLTEEQLAEIYLLLRNK